MRPGNSGNSGYSPGRALTVTVDYPDFYAAQDPWWKGLRLTEITGRAELPGTAQVSFINGIGWRLNTYHDLVQIVHEENATAAQRRPIENLPSQQTAPLKGIPTLTGVPTGSQVEGDLHNQQQVTAGDDWSSGAYNLNASDGASYPKPTETEIVPVDRKFVDTSPMQPDQSVFLRFWVPGPPGGASIGLVLRVYFTGLASSPNDSKKGLGQYSLSLFGDGTAALWEKGIDGSWVSRKQFNWCPPHQVGGHWHYLGITSDAFLDDDGHWAGSVINFKCQATQDNNATIPEIALAIAKGADTTQYVVPQTQVQSIAPVPLRLDARRDLRMRVSLSYTLFQSFGTLQTATFESPVPMGAVGSLDPLIAVNVQGSFPAGTDFAIALFGADGTVCTPSATTVISATSASRQFTRISGQNRYYALLSFSADGSQTHSPTVRLMQIIRNGVAGQATDISWTIPTHAVTDFSIVGPSMDPTIETGSIGLISLQDGFTVAVNGIDDPLKNLMTRRGQSVRIETSIPATLVNGVSQTSSTLMLGKAVSLRRKRIGHKRWKPDGSGLKAFPSRTWWQGKLQIMGLWKRLMQCKTTQTYNFAKKDPDTGDIFEITKIAYLLLSNMGLPTTMLDIPAGLGIKLLADPGDQASAYQVEVYSEAFKFVLEFVREYLGAAIVIDANATNGGGPSDKNGCVRLKLPPRPAADGSYPPLCQFVDDATWTSGLKEKLNLNSYAPYVRLDGHSVPTCPIFGWTMEDRDELPEGNWVFVSGCPVVTSSSGSWFPTVGKLTGSIVNWPAAHFFDGQPMAADPNHPDYTDGSPNLILLIDPALNTQGAVNFATRRIFDFACHRREYKTFEAPIVLVVDPLDSKQVRPRPLTWGDCVIYNGQYWFVSNVIMDANGERGGTRNGSALYELFRIPQLQEVQDGVDSVYQTYQLYGPVGAAAA